MGQGGVCAQERIFVEIIAQEAGLYSGMRTLALPIEYI